MSDTIQNRIVTVMGDDGLREIQLTQDGEIVSISNVLDRKTASGCINRLVMINPNKCMICGKMGDKISSLMIGHQWGWLYCTNCKNVLRDVVYAYIEKNNVIPCNWLFRSKNFTVDPLGESESSESESSDYLKCRYLKFYRHSQRGTNCGIFDKYDNEGPQIKFNAESFEFGMNSIFRKPYLPYERQYRFVTLSNIFAHNPEFYSELTTSEDLLDSADAKIGFKELPERLQNAIHNANIVARNKPHNSYLF